MLEEVEVVGLEPLQGLVELLGGGFPGAAVNLRHEENLLAIAVAEGLAHTDFAAAVVVVPGVVHEGDAGVDGGANDLDTLLLLLLPADVVAAQAEGGHLLSGAPRLAVAHVAANRLPGSGQLVRIGRLGSGRQGDRRGRRHRFEKLSPLHGNLTFPLTVPSPSEGEGTVRKDESVLWILRDHAGPGPRHSRAATRLRGEEVEHGPVEGRQVGGLAAGYPVAVLDDFTIDPVAARVADVVLEGVVAGQRSPAYQPRRHQLPRGVADGGEGFAGVLHGPQKCLHLRCHAHGVGVHGAAREMNRVKLLRAGVPDRAIDLDLHGLVEVVAHCLDLAGFKRKDGHPAPASRSAFTGSVSSDSSKPLVARTATRKSLSLVMMILLR